jgi:hypothetical protein
VDRARGIVETPPSRSLALVRRSRSRTAPRQAPSSLRRLLVALGYGGPAVRGRSPSSDGAAARQAARAPGPHSKRLAFVIPGRGLVGRTSSLTAGAPRAAAFEVELSSLRTDSAAGTLRRARCGPVAARLAEAGTAATRVRRPALLSADQLASGGDRDRCAVALPKLSQAESGLPQTRDGFRASTADADRRSAIWAAGDAQRLIKQEAWRPSGPVAARTIAPGPAHTIPVRPSRSFAPPDHRQTGQYMRADPRPRPVQPPRAKRSGRRRRDRRALPRAHLAPAWRRIAELVDLEPRHDVDRARGRPDSRPTARGRRHYARLGTDAGALGGELVQGSTSCSNEYVAAQRWSRARSRRQATPRRALDPRSPAPRRST